MHFAHVDITTTIHLSSHSLQLELLPRDDKYQVEQTLEEILKLWKSDCIGFIGPTSSGPTIAAATWLSIPSTNRAIVGYSATSPELSHSQFSHLVRTVPADDVPAKLAAKLMKGLSFFIFMYLFGYVIKLLGLG